MWPNFCLSGFRKPSPGVHHAARPNGIGMQIRRMWDNVKTRSRGVCDLLASFPQPQLSKAMSSRDDSCGELRGQEPQLRVLALFGPEQPASGGIARCLLETESPERHTAGSCGVNLAPVGGAGADVYLVFYQHVHVCRHTHKRGMVMV